MRLNVHCLNIPASRSLSPWVKGEIRALGDSRQIDEANVRLVRLHESSPAYQVHVHLVTPGPDVFVESRDHTLQAALKKALARLREKISSRAAKRLHRLKANGIIRRG